MCKDVAMGVVWEKLENAGEIKAKSDFVGLGDGLALGIELGVFGAAGNMIRLLQYEC